MIQLYSILKISKLGAGAAPDMYTALFAQKIKGGGEAQRSEHARTGEEQAKTSETKGGGGNDRHRKSVE